MVRQYFEPGKKTQRKKTGREVDPPVTSSTKWSDKKLNEIKMM